MNKESLKEIVESAFDSIGIQLVVEFVDNVLLRANELTINDSVKWSNAYESNHFTGLFIPNTTEHIAYILIENNRSFDAIVETCLHEKTHAIDYYFFLNNIFDGNQKSMIYSDLYCSFQIYSEFHAKYEGIIEYLGLLDDQTQYMSIESLKEISYEKYINNISKTNRYEFVMHSIQYLACLWAVKTMVPSFDLDTKLAGFEDAVNLWPIIDSLINDHGQKTIDWFVNFDKVCKEYIGAKNEI